MSKYNVESFYRALLPLGLSSNTLKVSKVPTLTTWLLTIDPNTVSEEIVEYNGVDVVNKTITITKRGVLPSANTLLVDWVDYNVAASTFTHWTNAIISWDVNNIHINQHPDFSLAVKTNVYLDASARNTAIPTPVNGMEVYLTTEGYFTDYTWGLWVTRASSTPSGTLNIPSITATAVMKVPTFANAAARDVTIGSTLNGQEAYIIAENQFTDFINGAWVVRGTESRFKVGTFSIGSTGAISVSGIGFRPRMLTILASNSTATPRVVQSTGYYDWTTTTTQYIYQDTAAPNYVSAITNTWIIYLETGATNTRASVTSFDSDGFTINVALLWVAGSTFSYIAQR